MEMIRYGLLVALVVLAGVTLVQGRQCCKTGYDDYTWCDVYCCDSTHGLFRTYDYCCSTYSNRVSYISTDDSNCEAWLTAHSWAIALIVLGNLAILVGIIVCCVCCIKGCCTSSSRPGPVVVTPMQQGPGVFMVNSNTTQQTQMQQPMQYGYGPPGPSGMGIQHPPPYSGPRAEKTGPYY